MRHSSENSTGRVQSEKAIDTYSSALNIGNG
eukprot:SAG22_NODE_15255_length_353_cov_0.814961_1_plen_30_part_10